MPKTVDDAPDTSGLVVARDGLLDAILKVQAEAPTLPKDRTVKVKTKTGGEYSYSYTPLDTIVEKIGPLLVKNALVWSALPSYDQAGRPTLKYKIAHAPSGDSIDGEMHLVISEDGQGDVQALGSAITYSRRYALCAVLNLVADDDDDGGVARTGSGSVGKPSTGQMDFLRKIIDGKARGIPKPSVAQLNVLLERIGSGLVVAEGWTGKLSRSQCSDLLDRLTKEPLPDTDNPSDVPADDPPAHPDPQPDGEPLPFEEGSA